MITAVEPNQAPEGQPVTLTITGRFHVAFDVNYIAGDSSVSTTFTAQLGDASLSNVTYVSQETLTARSAGLAAGAYDLTVVDPAGRSVTLPAAVQFTPAPRGPTQLFNDPLGDQTPFAFVWGMNGLVFVGPRQDGSGAVRIDPTLGNAPTPVSFSIPADPTGNTSRNAATPPFTSLGWAQCTADTLECGPDNEDGRGFFRTGTIAGTPWLVAGGARSAGDLDYVYVTTDTDDVLDFRYVDLASFLGPQTRGFSAAHVFNDRVFLGYPDTGGMRPYFLSLDVTPNAPGLDATATEATDLDGNAFPGFATGNPAMIDAIDDFGGHLYVANQNGCYYSMTNNPVIYTATDWGSCTPTDPAWAAKTPIAATKTADIEPRDRAVPAFAEFDGRFFMGRNTTTGPQLFICDPGLTGDATACEGDDWALVAPDPAGDTQRTSFNNPDNAFLSLLLATPNYLLVGFDNPQGIVVFRTSVNEPTRADFTGENGCVAAAHPSGCQGWGGNGFGRASNTQFFDARVIPVGTGPSIFATTGDGVGALRLYELPGS